VFDRVLDQLDDRLPQGRSGDRDRRLVDRRMEPDPAFRRSAGAVVLDPEGREHPNAAVVHPDGQVRVDPPTGLSQQIQVALGELVDNAIRYNESSTPSIEFRTDVFDDRVELHVVDNGPGIPDSELAVLAERKESPLVHSSGLGLWFVYWVVGDAGGDVSIQTPPDGGTDVTVSLLQPAAAESMDTEQQEAITFPFQSAGN
jgi:signal transduction histidine kinase